MTPLELIQFCFDEHVKDIGGLVQFTFHEYASFWKGNEPGIKYELKNRNGSTETCVVAYYPLPYYKDLRALVEIKSGSYIDFREVPVRFLNKKPPIA